MTPAELLDLIISRAPQLRTAGVRMVQLMGEDHVSFSMEPPEPAPPVGARTDEDEQPEPEDPLDDPATFGRKRGTPGFDISDLDDSEQ